MKKIIFFISVYICFSKTLFSFNIDIDVLNKYFTPIPVLVMDFYSTDDTKQYAESIAKKISELLISSGIIEVDFVNNKILDKFIKNNNIDFMLLNPNVLNYVTYHYTIIGKVINKSASEIAIEISIFNNISNQSVRAFGYVIPKSVVAIKQEILAKNIANEIYYQITKAQGYFEDSLLYTNGHELVIADYLGNNKQILLRVDGQIYAPIFSADKKQIIYVLFKNGISEIYVYSMDSKSNVRLAKLKGLSLSPVLSRDNQILLFAVMLEGAANIFAYDFQEKKVKKLTNSYSINLPGDFAADGELILFNSDRRGSPQIYTMTKEGKKVKKISRGKGGYYTPSFAPNKDIILYTNLYNKKFSIGVLSLNGQEKIIANEQLVESPKWVNDRTVVYQYVYSYNQKNKPLYAFYMLDILSGYKNMIHPEANAEDPTFSHGNLYVDKVLESKYNIVTYRLSPEEKLIFKEGSVNLLEDSSTIYNNIIVSELISYLQSNPDKKVSMIGYSTDEEEKNHDSSELYFADLRVNILKTYLMSAGIQENRILSRYDKGNSHGYKKIGDSSHNAIIELFITNNLANH